MNTHTSTVRSRARRIARVSAVALVATAGGCMSFSPSASTGDAGPEGHALTSSGRAPLPDDAGPPVRTADDADRLTASAAMLAELEESGELDGLRPPEPSTDAPDRFDARAITRIDSLPVRDSRGDDEPVLVIREDPPTSEALAEPAPAAVVSSGQPAPMGPVAPEDRKAVLVDELAGLLREIGTTPDEQYRSALALAGLEVLKPGAVDTLINEGALLPSEAAVLNAAKTMLRDMSEGGATPRDAMNTLDTIADKLNGQVPIEITAAALCTRVSGFGQYETFATDDDGGYTFLAGRRHPIVLYVEVDRFARRPIVGPDGSTRWEIALSQELQIYHEGDELMVTRTSPETDRTVTRSRMRDYYLINQTALPETLGAGRYVLKVIMRDENKNAVAETIVPIRMVSSRSALGQDG